MEEEAIATTTYWWCHMCSRTVDPLMEAEIKCPFCASGFVEEMAEEEEEEEEQDSPNTSLWAPILMQLITDPALRTTSNQTSVEDNQNHEEAETDNEAGNDVDSQLREILRRRGRRRGSVSVRTVTLSKKKKKRRRAIPWLFSSLFSSSQGSSNPSTDTN